MEKKKSGKIQKAGNEKRMWGLLAGDFLLMLLLIFSNDPQFIYHFGAIVGAQLIGESAYDMKKLKKNSFLLVLLGLAICIFCLYNLFGKVA